MSRTVSDRTPSDEQAADLLLTAERATTEEDAAEFDVNKHDEILARTHGRLRLLVLIATCAQTSLAVLVLSYSRRTLAEKYSPSSVLLVAELMKLAASLIILGPGTSLSSLVSLMRQSQPALVPAASYLVMNLLQYDSVGRLDAASFSVLSQLKMLTSALLSRLLLHRIITFGKWRALCVLVLGVVLIVHQSSAASGATPCPDAASFPAAAAAASTALQSHHHHLGTGTGHRFGREPGVETAEIFRGSLQALPPPSPSPPPPPPPGASGAPVLSMAVGVCELLAQTTISGFVGVYLERYLKRDSASLSIWEVNVQLASWSALAYAILCAWHGGGAHGVFEGWSLVTVAVAGVSALGGVLVALCLRYTDSVLKNLPAACSVAVVSCVSAFFLGGPATLPTGVGTLLVSIGVMDYSTSAATPSVSAPPAGGAGATRPSAPAKEEA